MNQVFNYYILAAALIASAFALSVAGASPMYPAGPKVIAAGGAMLSLVFWLLHLRGFQIAGLLDKELAAIEPRLRVTFNAKREESQFGFVTNTVLFSLIYIIFIIGFVVAACQADEWIRLPTSA